MHRPQKSIKLCIVMCNYIWLNYKLKQWLSRLDLNSKWVKSVEPTTWLSEEDLCTAVMVCGYDNLMCTSDS